MSYPGAHTGVPLHIILQGVAKRHVVFAFYNAAMQLSLCPTYGSRTARRGSGLLSPFRIKITLL